MNTILNNPMCQNPLDTLTRIKLGNANVVAVKYPTAALPAISRMIKSSKDEKNRWVLIGKGLKHSVEDSQGKYALVIPTEKKINWNKMSKKGYKHIFVLDNSMRTQYMAEHLVWLDEQGCVEKSAVADPVLF
jgi:hypothetical protein